MDRLAFKKFNWYVLNRAMWTLEKCCYDVFAGEKPSTDECLDVKITTFEDSQNKLRYFACELKADNGWCYKTEVGVPVAHVPAPVFASDEARMEDVVASFETEIRKTLYQLVDKTAPGFFLGAGI